MTSPQSIQTQVCLLSNKPFNKIFSCHIHRKRNESVKKKQQTDIEKMNVEYNFTLIKGFPLDFCKATEVWTSNWVLIIQSLFPSFTFCYSKEYLCQSFSQNVMYLEIVGWMSVSNDRTRIPNQWYEHVLKDKSKNRKKNYHHTAMAVTSGNKSE